MLLFSLPILFPYLHKAFWAFQGTYFRAFSFVLIFPFFYTALKSLNNIEITRKISVSMIIITDVVFFLLLFLFFKFRLLVRSCLSLLIFCFFLFFFFKQKTSYDFTVWRELRRVLFRSRFDDVGRGGLAVYEGDKRLHGASVVMAGVVLKGERSEKRRVGKEGRSRWSPDH